MNLISKLSRARRLCMAEWFWLARASASLFYVCLSVRNRKVRDMVKWATADPASRVRKGAGTQVRRTVNTRTASLITAAVARAARNLLPEGSCLPQALVTCRLLRRHGVAAQIVIGTNQPGPSRGSFRAHAWVDAEIGDRIMHFGDSVPTPYEPLVRFDRAV